MIDGGNEGGDESDGNRILRRAWIGTPWSIVSIKMQTLFEMSSSISIIVDEQTNVISVPGQIVEGSEDKLEETVSIEKLSLLVYTRLKIGIALPESSLGRRDTIGPDEQ